MILDAEKASLPTSSVIEQLASSTQEFYLTGSHYMGCARPDSDYDFMVQDTPLARAALADMGFSEDILAVAEKYSLGEIRGNLTAGVVQQETDGIKVQVQLCRDVPRQRKVRDIIRDYLLEQHIAADRDNRRDIWNWIADVLAWQPWNLVTPF